MAGHGRSRHTRARPENVWRLWSDPQTWHEWNPNVKQMEMNGAFINGTTGVMHTNGGQHHQVRLSNIQPGHAFDLETQAIPLTHFTFHCEVAARPDGSEISQTLHLSGPLAVIVSPLAGDRIAASFEPLLENLAARAEAGISAA